jgi:hypothetical protein
MPLSASRGGHSQEEKGEGAQHAGGDGCKERLKHEGGGHNEREGSRNIIWLDRLVEDSEYRAG